MLYPENCQERLGFNEVRQMVHRHCLSTMGQALVNKMQVMTKYDQINKFLRQTSEFKSILENYDVLTTYQHLLGLNKDEELDLFIKEYKTEKILKFLKD